jgi:hypothetical protein
VLWEYAKLNQHTKDVRYTPPHLPVVLDRDPSRPIICTTVYGSDKQTERVRSPRLQLVIQTRTLNETPDEAMLKRLRILERKMGLVLTLVRKTTRWLILIFLDD